MEKVWEWNAMGCSLPFRVVIKNCSECIVGGIGFDCDLSIQDPVGKDQSYGESFFK